MDRLVPFRVHFEGAETSPYDTLAADARDARKRGETARPGAIVRKVKVIREDGFSPVPSRHATLGETS